MVIPDDRRAPAGLGDAGIAQSGLLLLLLDSRAPSGGHAHSGGMEAAIAQGWVRELGDVEQFCRGRLHTAGVVAAAFAAAACSSWPGDRKVWGELDAEYEARLPSQAGRLASRRLGGGLRRMLQAMFPDVVLPWTTAAAGAPHHPIALGAGVALAGGTPELAAQAARLATITAPASAAVRLLGLDPLSVQAMLARIVSDAYTFGAPVALDCPGSFACLPADAAPALDLLADVHVTMEVRLFAS